MKKFLLVLLLSSITIVSKMEAVYTLGLTNVTAKKELPIDIYVIDENDRITKLTSITLKKGTYQGITTQSKTTCFSSLVLNFSDKKKIKLDIPNGCQDNWFDIIKNAVEKKYILQKHEKGKEKTTLALVNETGKKLNFHLSWINPDNTDAYRQQGLDKNSKYTQKIPLGSCFWYVSLNGQRIDIENGCKSQTLYIIKDNKDPKKFKLSTERQ